MEIPYKKLKNKMELTFDPEIPLLGLYPKNPETLIQKNLCTPMFIAERLELLLFMTAWIGTGEYYAK